MRESRTYGSVRGALSNGRPYRERLEPILAGVVCVKFCKLVVLVWGEKLLL
jgi:hypothetical protein